MRVKIKVFFLLLFFIIASNVYSEEKISKEVLVIYSNNFFSSITTSVNRAISEKLNSEKKLNITIYIESMEWDKLYNENIIGNSYKVIKEKYRNKKFDVVLAVDNSAYSFVELYGKELFKDTPIVFCGITEGIIKQSSINKNMTGNFKRADMKKNIENILKIHKDINEIVIILGLREKDKFYENVIKKELKEYDSKVKLKYFTDFKMKEMLNSISRLKKGTAIFYIGIYTDAEGKSFIPTEVVENIVKFSKVPVYGISEAYLKNGIVGGNLLSYYDLGVNSSEIALEILNGKKVEEIKPIVYKNKNYYIWKELKKYKIDIKNLPENSIVIDVPETVWNKYKKEIIALIVFFIMCIVVIFILTLLLRVKRNSEKRVLNLYDELKTTNGSLKDEIEKRNIIEIQLIESKNIAEEASYAKSQFLANMSHEIRTPMNGIIGMGEILTYTNLDEEQKKYVEALQLSADNMLGIINDILDISKIEAGKIEIELSYLKLEELAENVIELSAFTAQKKNIELLLKVSDDIPEYLETDEGKCRQILLNLVNNAIKFSTNGTVLVELNRGEEINEHINIEFSVSDTGIGIKEEFKKNIFKPFAQGDISYTKKYQGTGLGLAISKKLVEILGGNIGFETKEGIGSRFYFTIPMRKSLKYTNNLKDLRINLSKLSLLFIDDNEINRKITEEMLKNAGAKVYIAESGYKGIEILKSGVKIDLILLDVHMPEIDGFETAEKIKEEFGDKYNIVMFSSVDIRDNIKKINELGISDYLIKPVKRAELFKKIQKSINIKYKEKIESNIKKIDLKKEKQIMVVEDNEINMSVLINMLNKIGVNEIISAVNGEEAVELYKKYTPKLILMDIQMPLKNGYEANKEIIEEARIKNIKEPFVAALTAYAMKSDREKCITEGFKWFISKPFKLEELKECIEEFKKLA
jgi:signal transduction histidine kinase/response regulator RpfG family c-di-GMP phosphodiesterase/ABC-type uncharacterized transport system substrate-binding protein